MCACTVDFFCLAFAMSTHKTGHCTPDLTVGTLELWQATSDCCPSSVPHLRSDVSLPILQRQAPRLFPALEHVVTGYIHFIHCFASEIWTHVGQLIQPQKSLFWEASFGFFGWCFFWYLVTGSSSWPFSRDESRNSFFFKDQLLKACVPKGLIPPSASFRCDVTILSRLFTPFHSRFAFFQA